MDEVKNECELCSDQPEVVYLHARCHLTAPLQASLQGNVLILCCYLPSCGREVARFKVERTLDPKVPE